MRQQRAELGVSWADVVAAGLQALAESEASIKQDMDAFEKEVRQHE